MSPAVLQMEGSRAKSEQKEQLVVMGEFRSDLFQLGFEKKRNDFDKLRMGDFDHCYVPLLETDESTFNLILLLLKGFCFAAKSV